MQFSRWSFPAQGKSNKAIGAALALTEATVKRQLTTGKPEADGGGNSRTQGASGRR